VVARCSGPPCSGSGMGCQRQGSTTVSPVLTGW
jgi:hypothetical protein